MGTKAGVWIDHEHAMVVFLDDPNRKIAKFRSATRELADATSKGRAKASTTKNDFTPEDHLERKAAAQGKQLYDDVIGALSGIESLLIVGPGEAKGEFRKRLRSRKSNIKVVDLQTTDKMTDRQLASLVRAYFDESTLSPVLKSAQRPIAKPARSAKTRKSRSDQSRGSGA